MSKYSFRKNRTISYTTDSSFLRRVKSGDEDAWRDFLINKAMEELKESVDTETYQVFYMSFIQHCPVDEIIAVTRKTANNIYVIRFRCLAKLTAFIKQYRHFEEEMRGSHSHKNSEEY